MIELLTIVGYGLGFLSILAILVLIVWAIDHYIEMDWY